MLRILGLILSLIIGLSSSRDAQAVCGDVTGDGQRTASDALAVLRVAVGQPTDLVCTGGPSGLRYYNDFSCSSGSSVSTATFNGLTFEADAAAVSDYQTTALIQIDNIAIDLCGGIYTFAGPVYLPPDRSMTFWMVLLDPAVYQIPDVEVPAQFILADDGTSPASFVGDVPMTPSGASQVIYGGARR